MLMGTRLLISSSLAWGGWGARGRQDGLVKHLNSSVGFDMVILPYYFVSTVYVPQNNSAEEGMPIFFYCEGGKGAVARFWATIIFNQLEESMSPTGSLSPQKWSAPQINTNHSNSPQLEWLYWLHSEKLCAWWMVQAFLCAKIDLRRLCTERKDGAKFILRHLCAFRFYLEIHILFSKTKDCWIRIHR